MTRDQHQLGDLLAAAGDYTRHALGTLSPETGARVAAGRLYVTVAARWPPWQWRCHVPRACRLFFRRFHEVLEATPL
jgi:hypothetical protein